MFTGIVAAIGKITRVEPAVGGVRLTVEGAALGLADVVPGDSISHNGVCLTIVDKAGDTFKVDVSAETLNCTAGLDAPGEINLEKAMQLTDRLGGHLVSGHIDGVGVVQKFEPVGDSYELVVRAPAELKKYIARKGSITIDGASLTVNSVDDADFSVNLIPHTLTVTTLKRLKPGSRVNLEVDLIARYVERMLSANPE